MFESLLYYSYLVVFVEDRDLPWGPKMIKVMGENNLSIFCPMKYWIFSPLQASKNTFISNKSKNKNVHIKLILYWVTRQSLGSTALKDKSLFSHYLIITTVKSHENNN